MPIGSGGSASEINGMVRITLAGAALFATKVALLGYVDDMLNLGFDCPLQRDEAADCAAFRILVYVVEVPACFKAKREAVQHVEAASTTHDAAAPEKQSPGFHGVAPRPFEYILALRNRTTRRMPIALMQRLSGADFGWSAFPERARRRVEKIEGACSFLRHRALFRVLSHDGESAGTSLAGSCR